MIRETHNRNRKSQWIKKWTNRHINTRNRKILRGKESERKKMEIAIKARETRPHGQTRCGQGLVRERLFAENTMTGDVTECKWTPRWVSPCAGQRCVLYHSDLCVKNTDTTFSDLRFPRWCLPARFELLFKSHFSRRRFFSLEVRDKGKIQKFSDLDLAVMA